jgi:pyridinium-3,5-biscarboxylic acid mononucleotide sulfurtransferase
MDYKLMSLLMTETASLIEIKWGDLKENILKKIKDGLLIAFSGGVDSAFLLWAAQKMAEENGGRVMALTTTSESLPQQDREDVQKFIRDFNIDHIWVNSREMENPDYVQNDALRCYHCKTELFTVAKSIAQKNDLKWIAYGYNASDFSDDRPGHQASLENGILAPLAEVGFTKEEIRLILRKEGVHLAEKAASPCLSSRIAHGVPVTSGRLADIAFMESILKSTGIKIGRVRINQSKENNFLRIEVAAEEMEKVFSIKDLLDREGRARGYNWVTLDLAGYKTGGADS